MRKDCKREMRGEERIKEEEGERKGKEEVTESVRWKGERESGEEKLKINIKRVKKNKEEWGKRGRKKENE